tara:strand:+ start:3769 stop:4095 length:327 start_codon:yes stop_codon:yes gene_type:complete
MQYNYATLYSNTLSSKEDNQTYVFDIKINKGIIIREVINNKNGFIRINKKIKFKKINTIVCKLLDLKILDEYKVESNDIINKNILMHEKYCIKLENYEGNLTIFYHIY